MRRLRLWIRWPCRRGQIKKYRVITGSAYDDALTGNDGVNYFEGGLGADTLDGGAGSDTTLYNHSSLQSQLIINLMKISMAMVWAERLKGTGSSISKM